MQKTNNVATLVLARARDSLAKKSSLALMKSEPLDNQTSIALLRLSPEEAKSLGNLDRAVSKAWDNKVRALPGSAYRPNPSDPTLVVAILSLNRESRPFGKEGLRGLTSVTANIFRDSQDGIWRRVGEGEDAMIVRDTDEDLEVLMRARRGTSITTASVDVQTSEAFQKGYCVAWYDPATEKVRTGIAITSDLAFDLDTGKGCSVVKKTVAVSGRVADVAPQLRALIDHGMQRPEIAMLPEVQNLFPKGGGGVTAENRIQLHLQYMSILYKNHPEYFNRLKGLLRKTYGEAAVPA